MEELEGRDIFADDFIRQEQINQESENPTEIQKFFEETHILVTGGTGFFGKILVEKLIRVCSVEKIYLLMRAKRGKSVQDRFNEQFEGPLFEPMKRACPGYKDKVHLIEGDMAEEIPIFSEEERQMLIQKVHIVFHCAATVRFDEKLRRATNINVKGTKYILDMAHEMKNLKAFIHVSTAYANCIIQEIHEQFYDPPYDYDKITCLLNVLEDETLDKITPQLLDKFPNTYAFTKIIAESVVKEYGKGLPIGILRPSIVISTHKEPITGWINNYYGPQGVVFGAALGLLRTLHCDPNVLADMVPVDLVINAIIALAWDVGQTKGDNPNFEKVSWKENEDSDPLNSKTETTDDIPILNYVSSERNPITWAQFLEYNYRVSDKNYSPFQLWHSSLTLNANYYVDRLYRIVCHYLPALVVDLIAIIIQKKPILWNSYKKIHKFSHIISYFCTSQWKFREDNVIRLWNKLSPRDKLLFDFDIKGFTWREYFERYLVGLRVYLLNDDLSSVPQGRKRAVRLRIYHYLLVTFLYLLLFYMLYRVYSIFF